MNKNIQKIIAVVLILILGVGYYTFSKSREDSIKIGLMAPLSGEYASAGENLVKGVQLALDDFASQYPNKKIEIIIEDDGFVVGKGTSAYKKLIGIDKVDALISVSTPVIDAIHAEIIKDKLPVMQIGIQTVGIDPDNIFQNSPGASDGIFALAQYMNNKFNYNKIAVIYDSTPGGTIFFNVFKENYKKPIDPFVISSRDGIRSQVNKIIGNNYDALLMLNSPENGALMTIEVLKLGYKKQLIYDAQLQTGFADYKRILGDTKRIDGAISFWFKEGDATDFKDQFKNKYGSDPGFLADFGYDTFNTLLNAYSSNDETWIKNIQNTNGSGASGKIVFDKNGVRKQDISINQVKNGEIVQIDVVEMK